MTDKINISRLQPLLIASYTFANDTPGCRDCVRFAPATWRSAVSAEEETIFSRVFFCFVLSCVPIFFRSLRLLILNRSPQPKFVCRLTLFTLKRRDVCENCSGAPSQEEKSNKGSSDVPCSLRGCSSPEPDWTRAIKVNGGEAEKRESSSIWAPRFAFVSAFCAPCSAEAAAAAQLPRLPSAYARPRARRKEGHAGDQSHAPGTCREADTFS